MVKSYLRYESAGSFGVISSGANTVWIPPNQSASTGGSSGRAIVGGLEEILTWDLKTSSLLSRFSDGTSRNNDGHMPEVTILRHDPNMDLIAAGYVDGSIRVWDMKSGDVVVTFSGHKGAISALKFDKNGTRIVSGSKDSNIVLWDLVSETGLYRLRAHRDQITALNFVERKSLQEKESEGGDGDGGEEDEQWLVSVSKDGMIRLWDLETQYCVETHIAHQGECWAMDISDDNKMVATNGGGKEVNIWKLDITADEGKRLVFEGSLNKQSAQRGVELSFSPYNQGIFGLLNNDRTIEIFRLRSAEEIKKSVARKRRRRKDKKTEDGNTDEISENDIAERIVPHALLRAASKLRSFSWKQSAKRSNLELLLSLSNNSLETYTVEGEATNNAAQAVAQYSRLLSVDLAGHRADVRAMSVSSDDKLLATASNGCVKVWNIRTGSCLRTFDDAGYALCASFLPGDGLIVCGTKAGEIQLFDVASSSLIDTIEAHKGHEVWSLHVSSDGTQMVTGGADKTVKFWEFKVSESRGLKLKHKRTLELSDDVLSVRLSPDNKYISAALLDNTIKVFLVDTLKFYLSLYGHKLPVLSMDISHDSKLLISSSADKNIKIWGLDFGDCHKSIFAHNDSILQVLFDPFSHNFFSASKDKSVKYWDGDKFQNIQKLNSHHAEVLALAVGNKSPILISTSHDKSIKVWEQTDEPLFLEEEREKELEQMYESTLTESLEADDEQKIGEDEEGEEGQEQSTVERAGKQTIETLKSGEKLMEALEIGAKDLDRSSNETRHVILATLNVSAEKYVYDVVSKIKPAQLDDALLVLPLDKITQLFRFIEIWTENNNQYDISRVSSILYTTLRIHYKQVTASKHTRTALEAVKQNLQAGITSYKDVIGYNLSGLEVLKRTWQLSHNKQFLDDKEHQEKQDRMTKKRAFTTV